MPSMFRKDFGREDGRVDGTHAIIATDLGGLSSKMAADTFRAMLSTPVRKGRRAVIANTQLVINDPTQAIDIKLVD